MQPGESITPGQSPEPDKDEPTKEPENSSALSDQEAQGSDNAHQQTDSDQNEYSGWEFHAEESGVNSGDPAHPSAHAVDPVSWSASEYIAHHKNPGWFMMAGLAVIAVAIVVYLVTRDWVSAVVIAIAGILFAVYGARPPQVLNYKVDGTGLHIEQKFYPYGNYRSFSIQEEDAVRSILLMPTKRVGLPITIYYDPKDEDKIVQVLGSYLPHETREVAAIDKFMRKIRF